MKINSKLYDILKWVAIVVLPAGNLCVTAILSAVGVDQSIVTMISEIIVAVDAFLGALLGVTSVAYYKDNKTDIATTATLATSTETSNNVSKEATLNYDGDYPHFTEKIEFDDDSIGHSDVDGVEDSVEEVVFTGTESEEIDR